LPFFNFLSQELFVDFLKRLIIKTDSGQLQMMFAVIGCSFRRLISSKKKERKKEKENPHLTLQPTTRKSLTSPVCLKSTKRAIGIGSHSF